MEGQQALTTFGTSPRMRGKRKQSCGLRPPAPEHPRVCGENSIWRSSAIALAGTSPRMRGKQAFKAHQDGRVRNISAYAGKTNGGKTSTSGTTEHPRVCGENSNNAVHVSATPGTSPRMRGKPGPYRPLPRPRGNIPAYAGKTMAPAIMGVVGAEHPRVCGENCAGSPGSTGGGGTSPRMRGKLHDEA